MAYRINTDNIYPEGTLVMAKVHPSLQLVIIKYLQRIYYCAAVGDEHGKQQAYFERELTPVNPLKVTR
ncbi:hypothetical protein ACFQ21_17090 [Ohtaekwangia kribbensis]|jgi:hypothetical protein|uniref:Uncharacterized protein n=1 Tax=Ohtaekwangia kribbensis TaxID=688913 RepID=A0ABW3K4S6_9BACT